MSTRTTSAPAPARTPAARPVFGRRRSGNPVMVALARHLPLLLILAVILYLLLTTVNAFQAFTPAYVVSNGTGGPLDSTLFYTLYLYQRGFTNLEMGYASAMAWALVIVLGAFTAFLFATAKYWVHYGDEK